jgi:hypothetical protein
VRSTAEGVPEHLARLQENVLLVLKATGVAVYEHDWDILYRYRYLVEHSGLAPERTRGRSEPNILD